MQLSRLIGFHSPLLSMDCDCHWSPDDLHLRYQYISDFFIALAYFSIPLELIYFVKKSAVFPYRWVLVQFGAFIVLCGATHLINLWTLSAAHSPLVATVMTVSKVLTAVVSCATALMLVHIIPDLLSVKTRELFLKNKAAELDREMGIIRTQEETGRSVRMLTQEIRSTLDRHTILNTTMVELGKALALEECGLWMPTRKGTELKLTHTLLLEKQQQKNKNGGGYGGGGGGRTAPSRHLTVPLSHATVKQVLGSRRAVSLPSDSPLAVMTRPDGAVKYAVAGDAVAMRVPLLHLNNFRIVCDLEPSVAAARCSAPFALMVLVLPSNSARRWHVHELELVEVVAEQVAVALSHAAILEESVKARDLLMEQNVALDQARREAETAVRARHNFLDVMNHEMRTPTHAIIAFSSLLLETGLTHEQRSMVDTIHKSSNLLGTLINDVLDLSRLEEGSLELDVRTFNVPLLFREVLNLVKPIASVKKLALALHLDPDVPDYARGDDKRLLQITLNLVGNAIKFTEDGSVALVVNLERRELLAKDLRDGHYYLRVQVRDTGVGVNPGDIPKLFSKVSQYGDPASRSYATAGFGLAICKRFVKLMDGRIWIESAGIGKGASVTFVVKLHVPDKLPERAHSGPLLLPAANVRTSFVGLKALVVDDNMVNRRVTKGLLARLGCDVTTVGSGRDALLMLSQPSMTTMGQPPFAMLFVDIFMPEMDGFEVAVRAEELFPARSRRPLIIAVTASTDPSVRERCFSIGMDGILLKPFSLEKLRSMLNELLDRGLVERALQERPDD